MSHKTSFAVPTAVTQECQPFIHIAFPQNKSDFNDLLRHLLVGLLCSSKVNRAWVKRRRKALQAE